jgi:hypothetical protein
MKLMVTRVQVDAIEVSSYGQPEPELVRGRTVVTFEHGTGSMVDVDWTFQGAPPAVGDYWTFEPEANPARSEP